VTAFRSRIENCYVDVDGLAPLDDEWDYTAIPVLDRSEVLSDGVTHICAQGDDQALREFARRMGGQLLTADDVELLHAYADRGEAIELPAFTGTPTAETSLAHRIKSDEANRANAKAAGYVPGRRMRLCNFGKGFIEDPDQEGEVHLMGWRVRELAAYSPDRRGPGFVQPRPRKKSKGAHSKGTQADDGTNWWIKVPKGWKPPTSARDASDGSGLWGTLVRVGRELLQAIATDGAGVPPRPVKAAPRYPHGYRCAVSELCADGKVLGTLRLAADVRAGRYTPKVGDLVISARLGENPLTGGHGHVERIVSIADGVVITIGGNEANGWNVAAYSFADPNFVAVIDVPAELGARAVHIALAEKATGVREKPGAQHHPKIQAYHAGARRKGSPVAGMPGHEKEGSIVLGSYAADEIAWCASSASFCAYHAALALKAAA
jgi:hypothetical protein